MKIRKIACLLALICTMSFGGCALDFGAFVEDSSSQQASEDSTASSSNSNPNNSDPEENDPPASDDPENQDPPAGGGSEQDPPAGGGSEQDPPAGGGSEQDPPAGGGSEQDPPAGGGSEQDPPAGGGSEQDPPAGGGSEQDPPAGGGSGNESVTSGDLSIHFLELGNQYNGDCTLIKVGDTEVLIDAGSRKDSATALSKYIDKYCTDGVLEYVITTHAHQDHIAGFVGTRSGGVQTGILYQYEVETLIQFARTDSTTQIYSDYKTAVSYAQSQGTQVYTALQCWNNADGAQRTYYLDDDNKVSMNILYNYFYENKTSGGGGENEYSVCMLLNSGEENFLFTGDLEKKGEEYLVQYNTLPKCTMFKGGHHGSYTATNETLLSVIQPKIVCFNCTAGSTEYTTNQQNTFPAQAVIDRIAPYTDQVYVTTMSTGGSGYQSMNGNIVVSLKNGVVSVDCSNNNTILKNTSWFKSNRTMPNAWK